MFQRSRLYILGMGLPAVLAGCADLVEQTATPPIVRDARLVQIVGSVELEGLGACGGIEVSLLGPDGPALATTAADGTWQVPTAPAGAWTARVSLDGFVATEAVFVAAVSGETAVPPLLPTRPRVAVRGRVRLDDGGSPAGSAVAAAAEVAGEAPAGLDCEGTTTSTWSQTVLAGPDGMWETWVPSTVLDVAARIRREGYTEAEVLVDADAVAAAVGTEEGVTAPDALLFPLTGFVNVVGLTVRADRDVPLQVSAFNGVSQMALGEIGGDGVCALGPWQPYDATPIFTVGSGDGLHTICVLVRNPDGQQFGPMYTQIELDTVAPSGSLMINLGASITAQPIVTLGLAAGDTGSGVTGLRLAHDEAGLDATAEVQFEATKIWTLAEPYGAGVEDVRRVWLRVLDRAGNASQPVSAAILLDRAAPRNLAVTLPGAGGGSCAAPGWSASPLVDVAVSADDSGLGEGRGEVRAAPLSALAETAWQPWATRIVATATATNGLQEIRVEVRDAAGNVAGPVAACLLLDTQAPQIESLSAAGAGADPGHSSSSVVTLTLGALDNLALTADLQVCVAGDLAVAVPDCDDPLASWSSFAAAQPVLLAAVAPGATATREITVALRDPAGNVSAIRRINVNVDRSAPAAVPFQVASAGAGRVDLSWGGVAGAVRYRVDYDGADVAADSMAGTTLLEGASPRIVTGTSVRLTGLRSLEPIFFRVRAIDAAGNFGPDPGQSARGVSALIRHTLPHDALGNGGGTDGLPDLPLRRDAAGNLWVAYRSSAGTTTLLGCAAPCDKPADWQRNNVPLGYGAAAGLSQALLVEGSKLWLAETRPSEDKIRIGGCEGGLPNCMFGPWWSGSAYAWAVTISTSPLDLTNTRVRLARDDRGTLWLSLAGMGSGPSDELWVLSCPGGGATCASEGNWTYTLLRHALEPGFVHSDFTYADGTLWLLTTHIDDQAAWLLTCRPAEEDCADTNIWQRSPLPTSGGDLGPATSVQNSVPRLAVSAVRGGGIRVLAAVPVNLDAQPCCINPAKYVAVCEAPSAADCRSGAAWSAWREAGSGSFDVSLQEDRAVLVENDTFSNRFVSWVCHADCGQRSSWLVGSSWEDATLRVASMSLLGWGDGNLHVLYAGLFEPLVLLRPLLLPPARTDMAMIPGGVRTTWSQAAGAGYGIDLAIGQDPVQSVLVDDPAQLQLDVLVGADREVSTVLRARSALGSSEGGDRFSAVTPRAFYAGLPGWNEGGAPANDSYRSGVIAHGGSQQAIVSENSGMLQIRTCDLDCDGGGAWWPQPPMPLPNSIVWLDLAADADGFFGVVRTSTLDAAAHDLWSIRCEGPLCGTTGPWTADLVQTSSGAATRPGWAARAALDDSSLWTAHVVDDHPPLPGDGQHGGRAFVARCSRSDTCVTSDWTSLQLPWAPDQTLPDAHVALAAGPQAVWVLRSGGPLLLSECVHNGAGAVCGGPGAWSHSTVRNTSVYGQGHEPWGTLRKYDDAMDLAWDPATSTLIAFAAANQWPSESNGLGVFACRWVGAGSCSAVAKWRRVWPQDAPLSSFVSRARVIAQSGRVDVVFHTWNDLYQLGCNGDCTDPLAWTPLARIAQNVAYQVGAGAWGSDRIGWIHAGGGGDVRTVRTGPRRF